MKRIKILMSCVVVMALALTACDDPNMTLVPTESTTETVVTTETDEAEVTPTPAISGTPTPTIVPTGTTTTASSVADGTEATTTEAGSDSGNTSSGNSSEGGNASGGSNGGSSGGGSAPTTTQATETTPAPTEASSERPVKPTEATSNNYARRACSSCGQQKLVDTPNYRYTTPEKTHEETTETWDYGIQHCEVQINWKSNAKDLGNPPSITISFDRKVDTSGNPYDNNAENDATGKAMNKADEWLKAQGVENCSGYYSWQTNKGSTDKINYNKTTTTVVDEPEHEYEVGAYVCDNCGAVETYGTPKQIR